MRGGGFRFLLLLAQNPVTWGLKTPGLYPLVVLGPAVQGEAPSKPPAGRFRLPVSSAPCGLQPRHLVSACGVTWPSFPCLLSSSCKDITLEGVGVHSRGSQPGPAQCLGPQVPAARSGPPTSTSVALAMAHLSCGFTCPLPLLQEAPAQTLSPQQPCFAGDGQCVLFTSPGVVSRW